MAVSEVAKGAKVRAAARMYPRSLTATVVERLIFRVGAKRNPRGRRPRLQMRPDFCPSYAKFSQLYDQLTFSPRIVDRESSKAFEEFRKRMSRSSGLDR